MNKTFIIAEIGQAHDGSLGLLHSYIDAVAQTGVNAIKFQTHIAEAESSSYEPFRINFSYEDKTRFDYWKRMEFSVPQWKEIKNHCEERDVEFLSSPFSNMAVDLLQSLGVRKFKIGSGEINNFLMLEKIAKTGKEIILSSGMSSFFELNQAINFLKPFGNSLSILQCTTKYPTNAEDIGLNVITELKKIYDFPIGLSDHSGTIYPSLSAVTLGAEIIEFHVVFDKKMFGPDSQSSLTISETRELVKGVRYIERMRNSVIDKNNTGKFKDLKTIFEKSLAVNKPLHKGHILRFDDLEGKKPYGHGIDTKNYQSIIGKKINCDLSKWAFLKKEHIND